MASRRSIVCFKQAAAAAAAASPSLRQCLRSSSFTAAAAAARQISTTTTATRGPAAAVRCLLPPSRAVSRWGRKTATPATPARAYSQSAAAGAGESKTWDFEQVKQLTTAQQKPKSAIILVDTREPGELQDTGRIPGAINIPITTSPDSFHISADEFEDRFGYPRPAPDAEVVFYCRSGVRSRAAAGLAKDAGWTNVGEYPGSWLDWAAKGGKVER